MMAMMASRRSRPRPPLDGAALERLALSYVGRYATTRAKLRDYLSRKIAERGWAGDGAPPVERLIERASELGYVDDKAYALAKAGSLTRRGYGARRIAQSLRGAGIEEEDAGDARRLADDEAWSAALLFAERRRIGPFATEKPDRPQRQKALAAMLRAGHPMDLARRLIEAAPGRIPDAEID